MRLESIEFFVVTVLEVIINIDRWMGEEARLDNNNDDVIYIHY
jgi:hypothetical protein